MRWRARRLVGAVGLIPLLGLLAGCMAGPRAAEADLPARWTNRIGMELVRVPAGAFTMGTDLGEKDSRPEERPAHRVRMTRSFLMGRTEVTVGQFRQFVEATGYRTEAERSGGPNVYIRGDTWEARPAASWRRPGFEQSDRHPVVCVTWNDAQAFLAWLNATDRDRPANTAYRLPTEAEWEYAASGPTRRVFPWGNEWDPKRANFADATSALPWARMAEDDGFARTAPVGSYSPAGDSPFGLADLGGNVWEWCHDGFDKDFYRRSPADDPVSAAPARERVERGGSWAFTPDRCRVAFRFKNDPAVAYDTLGFRVVLAWK